MNKSAIQRLAIWARTELIEKVQQRAYQYGITKDGYGEQNAVTVGGRALTTDEQRQRKELVEQIRSKGYTQVMEEVAYTWFNRFIALRFMEVNNYLPSHIRVFSDSTGAFKPEILNDVLHLDLPGLNTEKVAEYIEKNQTEDLYRYLLLTQCNALNASLPQMFERMGGFTELLLPNNILKQDSILGHMVTDIPEEDWTDQVQIIGWLYQYYNSELKDDTFALLKKNVKITKERIPSATQLFTPDWIVRYMVENSLGRIFIDKRKNEGVFADGRGVDEMTWEESEAKRIANEKTIAEQMGWKYYLPEAEQTEEVRQQLDEIQREYANLDVKEIKVIDPCMGSGHILVYAFDVLMQIYEANGYSQRDAAQSILENNLYGLDIDDRAAQLAYFAVMMKARQYDRRLLTRGIQPNIYSLRESNGIQAMTIEYFHRNDPKLKADIERIVTEMRDAKEYGSILNITPVDFTGLYARFDEIREDINMMQMSALDELLPLVKCAELLAQKYDVVVTNPPYMGASGMNARLSQYIKDHFPDTKADLFACFIERGNQMAVKHGFNCMVTMQSWMFLSSFEKMREKVLRTKTITNLMHMENMVMGIAFGTAVTVFRNDHVTGYKGTYNQIKLQDIADDEPKEFPVAENRFAQISTDNFSKIPGSPVAYWVNESILTAYEQGNLIGDSADVKIGMGTGKNEIFVREWWEVFYTKIDFSLKTINDLAKSKGRYFPYNKGGEFRLWFGNLQEVLWFDAEGRRYMDTMSGHRENGARDFYCKEGLTWSFISSSKFGIRYLPTGCFFDVAGSTLFSRVDNAYTLGFLASCVCFDILGILNPTLNYQAGNIKSLPLLIDREDEVDERVYQNIQISKEDWDSYENSWDFKRNPLV